MGLLNMREISAALARVSPGDIEALRAAAVTGTDLLYALRDWVGIYDQIVALGLGEGGMRGMSPQVADEKLNALGDLVEQEEEALARIRALARPITEKLPPRETPLPAHRP